MENAKVIQSADDIDTLWVIVRCGKNLYGFDANLVGNMIALPQVTRIPDSINYMSGTISVRGMIIPLIDLRAYFGHKSADLVVEEFWDQRLADHKNWLNELKASVDEKREFTLATDPHMCAFGKWYDNYKSDNRILAGILVKFDLPHKRIHAIAKEVSTYVAEGKIDEAHHVIEKTTNTELKAMEKLFDEIKQAAREVARRRIAMVIEMEDRTLALDVDEVVAVERISDYEPAPQYQTSHLGITRIGRRNKNDELVLLMEELEF
ncbi:chemotaxis protein CheW [uncultured Desulfuromusa sp.]|uniref:chemotaxis protein CheW n=1 Tax=uncultured Desulfuromusa sp. TaxID=219183 RepID=UPI002AA87F2C|nr:chemotaxis protein CheW [uncultured Desulfuromusa sp.]